MVKVYFEKIRELSDAEAQAIIRSLSPSAQARLDKKRNKTLRLASLFALSLLSDEQRADLDYTESGIPFFKTLDADISISHSKAHAAVAISASKTKRVGVDVEDAEAASRASARFLTEREQAALKSGTSYTEIWTKKEALFKYLKNDDIPFIHLDSTKPEALGAKFVLFSIDNATLTVCADKGSLIRII